MNKKKTKKIKPKLKKNRKVSSSQPKNIKTRVKPRTTKNDRKAQLIVIGIIAIAILVFYFIFGIELALIAAAGTLFITGLTLLLRKVKNQKRKRHRDKNLYALNLSDSYIPIASRIVIIWISG